MKPSQFKRFDRREHPWLTPEVPTLELMEENPGYKVRRVRDPQIIRSVLRRQIVDQILSKHDLESFQEANRKERKKLRLTMADIDKQVEEAVKEIVWAIQTQTNEIVKIIEVNKIKKLTADDAEEFRGHYLHGLATLPWAFGSTLEEESRKRLDEVAEWIETRDVYGVQYKDYREGKKMRLIGIARLEAQQGVFSRVGYMGSLYVDPEFWGNGFGDALTRHRLDRAVELGMTEVEMTVTTKNTLVLQYFLGLGFRKVRNREGKIGNKTYDWTDLSMPLNLWKKRREIENTKTKQEKLSATTTPIPKDNA